MEDLRFLDSTIDRFEYLRNKYHTLLYKSFEYRLEESNLHIEYSFEIEGLSEFITKWDFPLPEALGVSQTGDYREILTGNGKDILEELIFSLGMVEAISYYKIACPYRVVIECGDLNPVQKDWWRKLFYNGLGEFLYRNGINIAMEELLDIVPRDSGVKIGRPIEDSREYKGNIVPIGGGKDSCVTMELLAEEDFVTSAINPNTTTDNVIALCDSSSGNIRLRRVLDKRMLELNSLGYLNGHTPFSACVAFSGVLAAFLLGRKNVVLSNENSANESTVADSFVNHQYSKSYEFERDFQEYIKGITISDIHYFSLLRPLSELQIAALFSRLKVYHKAFRSCNTGSRQGIWCCSCPKCLFVYIILSPFLTDGELEEIFGENLLDRKDLDMTFRELMGIEDNKPFECVGTRREVRASVRAYLEKGGTGFLPVSYSKYIEEVCSGDEYSLKRLLNEWNEENNVPDYQADIVRRRIRP